MNWKLVKKARKNHDCRCCERPIIKGSECYSLSGIDDEGRFRIYGHPGCKEEMEKWDYDEWESSR